MKKKYIVFFASILLFMGFGFNQDINPVVTADAGVQLMTHDACIQHLFQHLELVEPGTVLSVKEKMEVLKQLNFRPRGGYLLGESLLYGQMADILVRVYGLEGKLPVNYTVVNAIQFLLDEKILEENLSPEHELTVTMGVKLINEIPRSPIYKQRTVLLPRNIKEPPVSRCE